VHFQNKADSVDAVVGNSDRLIQVFVNLLRNAVYAVPANGNIVVRSRRFMRNRQRWIAVAVEDDGPGIPADVLPNIFEAFVSSRLDARGTGLGLTVAEGIIDQHGGTITASNRPGGGACLEVTLLASAAPAHAAAAGAGASKNAAAALAANACASQHNREHLR
jgi:signal transduction histidine kinase